MALKIFLFLRYIFTCVFFFVLGSCLLIADPVPKTFLNLVRSYPLSEINSLITWPPFFGAAPKKINYYEVYVKILP